MYERAFPKLAGKKIKVANFGIGVIGSAVVKTMVERKSDWIDVVAAIDTDSKKVGKDLGEVAGLGKRIGLSVSNNLDDIASSGADIVVHTTSSYLSTVMPQLKAIASRGADIVSSCEELSNPYIVSRELSSELDKVAKENSISILGTGINPGFVMDVLPIVLTSACTGFEEIRVARQMNAANRRIPFQKKIGAGMRPDEFRKAIQDGVISGHVGLTQSISMLADAVGWKLDKIEVSAPEPVVLERETKSDWLTVKPGTVAGTSQQAFGMAAGRRLIQYDFRAYIGATEEFDAIEIVGTPAISFKSSPCINGDEGTIAMLINTIPIVLQAGPGLLTMKDVRLPSAANIPMPRVG